MLYEWLNAELSLFCTELDELRIRLNLNPIRIRKLIKDKTRKTIDDEMISAAKEDKKESRYHSSSIAIKIIS